MPEIVQERGQPDGLPDAVLTAFLEDVAQPAIIGRVGVKDPEDRVGHVHHADRVLEARVREPRIVREREAHLLDLREPPQAPVLEHAAFQLSDGDRTPDGVRDAGRELHARTSRDEASAERRGVHCNDRATEAPARAAARPARRRGSAIDPDTIATRLRPARSCSMSASRAGARFAPARLVRSPAWSAGRLA